MKFAHVMALLVFGLAYLFTQELAKSVDIAASWGFGISIIIFCFVFIWPLLITAGGGLAGGAAGGSAGGILGTLLGVLGGGALSILMFAIPIIFVLLSCFGYHFLDKWGASGLEDSTSGITGGVLLGVSLVVSLLKK